MASFPIPAPAPMSLAGDISGNWSDFKRAWYHYSIATRLSANMEIGNEEERKQARLIAASTLCSVMGGECLKVVNSLPTISEDDQKDPAVIIDKLTQHFIPQKHVLFERYKFNTAVQDTGEPVDAYVVRLRQLADACEFGAITESLIRDRLVIGAGDTRSRDHLLRKHPVPDLAECILTIKAAELSKAHSIPTRRPDTDHGNVDRVKATRAKPKTTNLQVRHSPLQANVVGVGA